MSPRSGEGLVRAVRTAALAKRIKREPFTPSDVAEIVAREFGAEMLLGATRFAPVVRARHLGMLLALQHTGATQEEIGRAFNRDHSAVSRVLRIKHKDFARI